MGTLVLAWLFVANIAGAFQCIPPQRFWQHDVQGHCFDTITYDLATGIANILLDIMILVLPVFAILRLQMSRFKKSCLLIVFLLGGL